MRVEKFSFGSIPIDASTYEHDVIIDRGEIRKSKKIFQEISRAVRPHAALDRRKNPLAMPQTRPLLWCLRPTARDAGRAARSRTSENQIACPSHYRSNRGVEARAQRHQCNCSHHMLHVRHSGGFYHFCRN
jgi:hypothetical protein